jgi:hypothetical protein
LDSFGLDQKLGFRFDPKNDHSCWCGIAFCTILLRILQPFLRRLHLSDQQDLRGFGNLEGENHEVGLTEERYGHGKLWEADEDNG